MHPIKKTSKRGLHAHLFPSLLAIILYELVAMAVYMHASLALSSYKLFAWISTQAIGSVCLGILSDKFCRKKMFIFTMVWGAIFLPCVVWLNFGLLWLTLLGLGFSPSPIARAALVDNFPHESKVKLMCFTFIAQFIPWSLYLLVGRIGLDWIFWIIWIGTIFVVAIVRFLFEDRRDQDHTNHETKLKQAMSKNHKKKNIVTLIALLAAQIVFFLTDSYYEEFSSNASLYTALGIGGLLGTLIAIFYRKTPHISIITIVYGIGFMLALLPFLSINVLKLDINLRYQLMMFTNLGGFYLPFIYDIILSGFSSNMRGTACGIIDLVISSSSLIGMGIVFYLKPSDLWIIGLTAAMFLLAAIIQRQGEPNVSQKNKI